MQELPKYSLKEVAQHDGKDGANIWIVIYDMVYDVTEYKDKVRKGYRIKLIITIYFIYKLHRIKLTIIIYFRNKLHRIKLIIVIYF